MLNANTLNIHHIICADNIFFRNERKKIILEQQERQADADGGSKSSRNIASVGFANLANIVSKRWWNISPAHKEELEKQAKLEKERYMKEVAAWELKERGRGGDIEDKKVIDPIEDDDVASRRDDLQMTLSTNQGLASEGGGMFYPSAFYPQWLTPTAFNQSIALNQASLMSSNYASTIPTMNRASSLDILRGPDESFFDNNQLPFRVDTNRQRSYPRTMSQGSLLFNDNMPTHSFQFEGRRNSMPYSFQSERSDHPMTNFGVDSARQHRRRASLFSSVGQMSPDITHESNFRPIEEIPIEEIKRFFNINPETNKVETPKYPRHD
jgi:hypothetical protein